MAAEKPLPTCQFEDPNPRELWETVLKKMLFDSLLALEEEAASE